MTALIAAFAILVTGMAGLSLWTLPIRLNGWRGWAVPAVLTALYVGAWVAGDELLGRPKPLVLGSDMEVIAYVLDEPRAIYLWTREAEPRAYKLPWDTQQAQRLRDAFDRAQESGTALLAHRNDGQWQAGDWMFYPDPVPPLPLKLGE